MTAVKKVKTKMTKELLESYRKLKAEIPLLEAELSEMLHTNAGIGQDTVMDYKTGYPKALNITGFDQKLYDRRKHALSVKLAKVKAVEDWIDAIEDGQTRIIFRLYYIDGMSWARIAEKTGHKNSPDYPRLYIRDKYLREQGIV